MDDIQSLYIQNNTYREVIDGLKGQIAEYDKKILLNERLIGVQLNAMEEDAHMDTNILDCTMCMGSCITDINLGDKN